VRQARLLRMLSAYTSVPVPRVLHVESGEPPKVPPFYVVAAVRGECWEPLTDESGRFPVPEDVHGRALDAACLLADVHAVPAEVVAPVGLDHVELRAEVENWSHVLERAEDPELRVLGRSCVKALLSQLPDPLAPTLVHGDFRLGNQICLGASVRAILDWEISTVSDPRIDVAWFLMTLSSKTLPSAVRANVPGLPDAGEVARAYEASTGRPLVGMPWFTALAGLRAAAAMALNVKHNRRSAAPSARVERYSSLLSLYLETARTSLMSG
jgi:aminoglycoside phosphotransferase (APT) family kinase protein